MLDRDTVLVEAVRQAKMSEFGLTGVKVEFEAVFGRTSSRITCPACEGNARLGICTACNGEGNTTVEVSEIVEEGINCDECNTYGSPLCELCQGNGRISNGPDYGDMKVLQDIILSKVVRAGLAERISSGEENRYGHKYKPKHPLVFSKVYPDATVDTEQTLTISVEGEGGENNILHLEKLCKAYASLKDDIGNGIDVSESGMHIALLNSKGAVYPDTYTLTHYQRYKNFQKSMILLMPALYLLGSSGEKSRSLDYRKPQVGCEDTDGYDRGHLSAINYTNGALEFRVFETCYDRPEVILDNVAVALNCLKFWTTKYTRNHLQKVANNVNFGVEGSNELKRFYITSEHINLLNRGLRMIKPSYLSITEIKRQRNFTITRKDTRSFTDRIRAQAEQEYVLYDRRFQWELLMRKNNFIASELQRKIMQARLEDVPEVNDTKVMEEIEKEAEVFVEKSKGDKQPRDIYCIAAINRLGDTGDYNLCVV